MEQIIKETKSISERITELANQLAESYERGFTTDMVNSAYDILILCKELERLATKIMYR